MPWPTQKRDTPGRRLSSHLNKERQPAKFATDLPGQLVFTRKGTRNGDSGFRLFRKVNNSLARLDDRYLPRSAGAGCCAKLRCTTADYDSSHRQRKFLRAHIARRSPVPHSWSSPSVQDECELAAAIARGVAHTALRSATGELTRFNLINLTTAPTISVSVPPIFVGVENGTTDTSLGIPLTGLHYRRLDESAADYFGIEYLYKSGYAPECFISFVRKAWPFSGKTTAKAFSPFPPLPERLDALQRDIKEILPKPSGAITDTEEFESFRKHLVDLPPPKPSPKQPNPFAPIRKHSIDW
jgi:hypothetical protein